MARAKRVEEEMPREPKLELIEGGNDDAKAQEEFIKRLSDGALQCRASRNHHWEGWGTFQRIDKWNVGASLECSRCHMRKVVIYERGQRGSVATRYFPPEGYSRKAADTPTGVTALSPLQVQEELMRRATVTGTNDDVRSVWNAYRNRR